MEGPLSRVLIGGACRSCGSEPPLAQRNIKRGARRGTGTNVHRVHSAPQILAKRSDHEGAEARGTDPPRHRNRHAFHTDATDSYHNHRRRHVVFLIASRYL
jgi:hypothetical protein